MPRTPAETDDDLAVPIAVESPEPTPSAPPEEPSSRPEGSPRRAPETAEPSRARPGASTTHTSHPTGTSIDGEISLLSREIGARAAANDPGRAVLLCVRALLRDPRGVDARATEDWRAAFRLDPRSWLACWGLRRQLWHTSSFDEWLAVIDLRLALPAHRDTHDRPSEIRAALWLERGRLFEDHFQRLDVAAESYRAGLVDFPTHSGLRLALLWLAFRRPDPVLTAEALAGLLRARLPSAKRVALTVLLARGQRASAGGPPELNSLESLRATLRAVGPEDARPLFVELATRARRAPGASARASLWTEIASQLPRSEDAVAAALWRHASSIDRDAGAPSRATPMLLQAWTRQPGHPLIPGELADAVEGAAGPSPADRAQALSELLPQVLGDRRTPGSAAEKDLVLRWLSALVRAERLPEAADYLDRHPELSGARAERFALELAVRLRTGDIPGMVRAFRRLADAAAAVEVPSPPPGSPDSEFWYQPASDRTTEAHALVMAGLLSQPAGGDEAERLFRQAIAMAPDYAPCWDALAAVVRHAARWNELAEVLANRLDVAGPVAGQIGPVAGQVRQVGLSGEPDASSRLLEELVVVHRDRLDDPETACRHQDALISRGVSGAREWVRRWDLELVLAEKGRPSPVPVRLEVLRALGAAHGEYPALAAALAAEAGGVAKGGGQLPAARALFEAGLAHDPAGLAAAGLERLAPDAAARADVVRGELARLESPTPATEPDAARVRALRFRLAWHCGLAGDHRGAVEALAPLVAGGDVLASGLSFNIARQSNEPALAAQTLAAPAVVVVAPADGASDHPAAAQTPMELASDRGETRETLGELAGAAHAFRVALGRAPSADVALGLLRVGAASRDRRLVRDGMEALGAYVTPSMRRHLDRERALFIAVERLDEGAEPAANPPTPVAEPAADEPEDAVLRWVQGIRSGDPLRAASGLLAVAMASSVRDADGTRGEGAGLLVRAAFRARLAGTAAASAVHDEVLLLSRGLAADSSDAGATIGPSLADLPVAGKPERTEARVARAARVGGVLAYALDLECALDAEARGDAGSALAGFARALGRAPRGVEALEGIRRVAVAVGDRRGAARAGMRLGTVLRAPAGAAAAFERAGELWEELGLRTEACTAYWQALARDASSERLYVALRRLLVEQEDFAGLDRLYGIRLFDLRDERARVALLLTRGRHRLERLADRDGAIQDFKRILRIAPKHGAAIRHLASLAVQMGDFPAAASAWGRLLRLQTQAVERIELRLKLADALASAGEPLKAVAVLRASTLESPRDTRAFQRMTELLLHGGDWRGALDAMRTWSAQLTDPVELSRLWVRRGMLHRDYGKDDAAAAGAFRTAAELDPMGDGMLELTAHLEKTGAWTGLGEALSRFLAVIRQSLVSDPLDVPTLGRLRALLAVSGRVSPDEVHKNQAAVGFRITSKLLEVLGDAADGSHGADDGNTPQNREQVRDRKQDGREDGQKHGQEHGQGHGQEHGQEDAGEGGKEDGSSPVHSPLAARLAARVPVATVESLLAQVSEWPAAVARTATLWTHVAPVVARLLAPVLRPPLCPRTAFPRPTSRSSPSSPSSQVAAELAWMVTLATALGIPTLRASFEPSAGTVRDRGVGWALAVDAPGPELVLLEEPRREDPARRFQIARTLALHALGAVLFDQLSDADVDVILGAAGGVAGVSASSAVEGRVLGIEVRARTLVKAMSRRDRQALQQDGVTLGPAAFAASAYRLAALEMADRIGLASCGDLAVALQSLAAIPAGPTSGSAGAANAQRLRASPRAMSLIAFALSDGYLEATREMSSPVAPATAES